MVFRRIEDLPIELRQQWAAGRVWAAHQAPYLSSALLALEPVVIETGGEQGPIDLRAFPTDPRWHVYVDAEVLGVTAVTEIGFWLLHQIGHLLREHAARFPGQTDPQARPTEALVSRTPEQRRWNVATDAEINDDLYTAELTLPRGAVTPAALGLPDGWIAERYWDALIPGAQAQATAEPEPEPFSAPLHGSRELHDCGSGADGVERGFDAGGPGLSETSAKMLIRDVARQVRRHKRERGHVPGGWERWAAEVLQPTVDWRRELAAHVRWGVADITGQVDFTYRRPSRRSSAVKDVILPSLHRPLPQVALVLDTSASMSEEMLGQALGETSRVLRSLGVARRNLKVIACDAEAYEVQRVHDLNGIRLTGGGGSDARAGVDAAAQLRPRPDVIIVLTDGFTRWRAAPPPGSRVIVGLMDPAGTVPDWADKVLIGDHPAELESIG